MPKVTPETPTRLAFALDPDRMGMFAGAALGSLVLAVSLFARHTEITEAIVRAGVVFVVAYAAVSVLVFVIKQITLAEVARRREETRQQLMRQKKESDSESAGDNE